MILLVSATKSAITQVKPENQGQWQAVCLKSLVPCRRKEQDLEEDEGGGVSRLTR